MNPSDLQYYAVAAPMTDLSRELDLLGGLPTGVGSLCEVVQGVLVHGALGPLYEFTPDASRLSAESELRSARQMLARIGELDSRPLVDPRPPERRLLGTCRDFATLLTALLRMSGTPARARCGFASYFVPGRLEDHWVCEVWSPEQARWVWVDAQVDSVQRDAFKIDCDPLDLSPTDFIAGSAAWLGCRRGEADPGDFGLSMIQESGLWFICGDFVRDVAALNKVELLPWDSWGILTRDFAPDTNPFEALPEELLAMLSPDDVDALDCAADQCADPVSKVALREIYDADSRFRVERRVRSAIPSPERWVDLDTVWKESGH